MDDRIQAEKVERCLLCGESGRPVYKNLPDRLFDVPGTWDIWKCPSCDLGWLTPRPLADEIPKLYASYYTHATQETDTRLLRLRRLIKDSILGTALHYDNMALSRSSRRLGKVLGLLPFLRNRISSAMMFIDGTWRGKLLDVGCGNGLFLAHMRKYGWDVAGIEPDVEAARVAREKYGIRVVAGDLKDSRLEEESLDVITMNHVIEHFVDPVGQLKECRRLLKTGGRLVLAAPNIRSLARRLYGPSWFNLDPPRHFYHFSPRSFRACAERAGFHVRSLRTISRSSHVSWSASRLIQKNGKWPGIDRRHISPGLRLQGRMLMAVDRLLIPLLKESGDEILMIATKEDGHCR